MLRHVPSLRDQVQAIFERVDETLEIARAGARDVAGRDAARRIPGLLNVAVFGRAVTNKLQSLRSVAKDFDEWYAPKVAEMRADPLCAFFYRLRTDGLKRTVRLPTDQRFFVKHFEFPKDMARLGPPPPGAANFFMGDRTGGSGWIVRLHDGTEERFYVDLPDDIAVGEMIIIDPPKKHLGAEVQDVSAAHLCRLYVDYLTGIVREARARFTDYPRIRSRTGFGDSHRAHSTLNPTPSGPPQSSNGHPIRG